MPMPRTGSAAAITPTSDVSEESLSHGVSSQSVSSSVSTYSLNEDQGGSDRSETLYEDVNDETKTKKWLSRVRTALTRSTKNDNVFYQRCWKNVQMSGIKSLGQLTTIVINCVGTPPMTSSRPTPYTFRGNRLNVDLVVLINYSPMYNSMIPPIVTNDILLVESSTFHDWDKIDVRHAIIVAQTPRGVGFESQLKHPTIQGLESLNAHLDRRDAATNLPRLAYFTNRTFRAPTRIPIVTMRRIQVGPLSHPSTDILILINALKEISYCPTHHFVPERCASYEVCPISSSECQKRVIVMLSDANLKTLVLDSLPFFCFDLSKVPQLGTLIFVWDNKMNSKQFLTSLCVAFRTFVGDHLSLIIFWDRYNITTKAADRILEQLHKLYADFTTRRVLSTKTCSFVIYQHYLKPTKPTSEEGIKEHTLSLRFSHVTERTACLSTVETALKRGQWAQLVPPPFENTVSNEGEYGKGRRTRLLESESEVHTVMRHTITWATPMGRRGLMTNEHGDYCNFTMKVRGHVLSSDTASFSATDSGRSESNDNESDEDDTDLDFGDMSDWC